MKSKTSLYQKCKLNYQKTEKNVGHLQKREKCQLGLDTYSWWLVFSFLLMVCYELYWLRYFRSEKTMEDFYSSFLGVPVAGATLPVAAFFLLAVYGRNPALMAAVVILGIGHIGIHLTHRGESRRG